MNLDLDGSGLTKDFSLKFFTILFFLMVEELTSQMNIPFHFLQITREKGMRGGGGGGRSTQKQRAQLDTSILGSGRPVGPMRLPGVSIGPHPPVVSLVNSRANRDIVHCKSGVCSTLRAKFYSVAQEAGFCLQDKLEILMK